jgi:uncharacterized protein YjeT (DUF2065 family)
VRSLGLVLVIVGLLFFFARPPSGDAKKIRVIDPSGDVKAFSAAVRGGAVPRAMPAGWRSTVSGYDDSARLLRIGWVTPKGEYAEYAAADRPSSTFVSDITGQAPKVGSVVVAGMAWQEYRQDDTVSLVRTYGTTTVVLGTMRDTATLDELRVLAGHLGP